MYDLAQQLCKVTSARGIPYHQWNKGGLAWNRAMRESEACGATFIHGQTCGFDLNLELSNATQTNMRSICVGRGGCFGESPFFAGKENPQGKGPWAVSLATAHQRPQPTQPNA